VLHYEPPVHYRTRLALADIEICGMKIAKGSPVVLLLAAGSRDPDRLPDPDRFDPDRENNAHFGFGGSLHYCVGAPLARIEGEVALVALARRLLSPRVVDAVPPYRPAPRCAGPVICRSQRSTASSIETDLRRNELAGALALIGATVTLVLSRGTIAEVVASATVAEAGVAE
jgi:cytochrome P450